MNNAPCIVCSAAASPCEDMPIDSKKFTPTRFGKLFKCSKCSLVFVFPRPRPEDTAEFYQLDAYYTHGQSHIAQAPPAGVLDRVRVHLAWRVDRSDSTLERIRATLDPATSRICDIGCGSGDLAKSLVGLGYRVVGVERDTSAISLNDPAFQAVQGSVENLPAELEPGSFDGVVMSHVLEHIVDPLAALKSASRLLRKGGLFFCEVPNNDSAVARWTGLAWEHLDIPRHLSFFGPESLRQVFESAGLGFSRHYYAGYCRFFSNSWIAHEARIADAVHGAAPDRPKNRNSRSRAWKLLARTAVAAPGAKYDAVGIVATKS